MTEKRYSGFGSRIVLKTLKPSSSSSDDEDIFLSNSIADRPELRVQVRYFTVELKPSKRAVKKDSDKYKSPTINIKHGSNNDQYKAKTRGLSNEASSCESFHSCRSTTSVQEVKHRSNEKNGSGNACSKQQGRGVRKTIQDDDLLNNLTMVNAIFLDDSVIESTQHELTKKNNIDKLSIFCAPSSSRKVSTEAYCSKINQNPQIRFTDGIRKSHGSTKAISNNFGHYNEKNKRNTLSYSKAFSDSFEPVLNAKSRFEMSKTVDSNDLMTGIVEVDVIPSSSSFHKNIFSKSSVSVVNRVEETICKMQLAEINPLTRESGVFMDLQKNSTHHIAKKDQTRRRVIPGCEESPEIYFREKSLPVREIPGCESSITLSSPKNSSSLVFLENANKTLDLADMLQGNCNLGFQNKENSEGWPLKHLLKDIDESRLKMMVRKSFKKLQIRSGEHLQAIKLGGSEIFESDEESCNTNENKSASLSEMDSTNTSLVIGKQTSGIYLEVSDSDGSKMNKSELTEDKCQLSNIVEHEIKFHKQNLHLKRSEPSKFDERAESVGNEFGKISDCERPKNIGLAVIEEERSEESFKEREYLREGSLDDDYCLIDNNGKPIHLFDSKGLPLTDNSGRPLRSAQDKLLMHCDQSGIPVVDAENPIFDMVGRQPHEEGFDPSLAPGAAGGRLAAGDGRPLVLYDARGRPLTTRSGTMLLDSAGRGLLQLTNPPAQ